MNIKEALEKLEEYISVYEQLKCQIQPSEVRAIETVLAELEKKDNIVRGIIQRLDNDIKNISKTKSDGKHADDYSRCRLKAYKTKTKEIKEYIEKQYFEKKIEEDK